MRNLFMLTLAVSIPLLLTTTLHAGFLDDLKKAVEKKEEVTEKVDPELVKKVLEQAEANASASAEVEQAITNADVDTAVELPSAPAQLEKIPVSTPQIKSSAVNKSKPQAVAAKPAMSKTESSKASETRSGTAMWVLPSATPAVIAPIKLPTMLGKVRLGYDVVPHHIKIKTPAGQAEAIATMKSMDVYRTLKLFNIAKELPSKELLKKYFYGMTITADTPNARELEAELITVRPWFPIIHRLASNSFTPEAYTNYMCTKKQCTARERQQQRNTKAGTWGGEGASQFERRRAFHDFIDTHLDSYFAWAKQLDADQEFIMVGQTRLSPYLFEEGGFAVPIEPVGSTLGTGGSFKDHPAIQHTRFKSSRGKKSPRGTLVKIDEATAEKIVERSSGKAVYYYYFAKLSLADSSYNPNTGKLDFSEVTYNHVPTSKSVVVFLEQDPSDTLFEIELTMAEGNSDALMLQLKSCASRAGRRDRIVCFDGVVSSLKNKPAAGLENSESLLPQVQSCASIEGRSQRLACFEKLASSL